MMRQTKKLVVPVMAASAAHKKSMGKLFAGISIHYNTPNFKIHIYLLHGGGDPVQKSVFGAS
jgi:hypothetical protein